MRAWVGFTLALVACQEAAGITKVPEDEVLVLGPPRGPRVGSPTLGLDPPLLVPFVEHTLAQTLGSSAAVSLDLDEAKALSGGLLSGGAELEVVDRVRQQPLAFRGIAGLFQAPASTSRVAARIRQAARLLSADAYAEPAIGSFEEALAQLCPGACPPAEGRLSPELAQALGPILNAAAEIDRAQRARAEASARSSAWWFEHGGDALLAKDDPEPPNPADLGDRAYLLSGRERLYAAAATLVEAIEAADLQRFAGGAAHYRLETPLGLIRVEGRGDDRYPASPEPTLLFLELGGDDLYLQAVAANQSAEHPVSIHLDLEGDDRYTYPEAEDAEDERLPADAAGRGSRDGVYRRASLSANGRQASAKSGVAILFDFEGDDHYQALQASQAYADQGVAVLADLEGHDRYQAEAVSQGAAQSGIAILYDEAGNDDYQAVARAQGFGFVAGFGALDDQEGDDRYACRVDGGIYPSPQDEELSASLCQGAGLGLRTGLVSNALGGGLGLLRDQSGDDRYQAAVFAQGVGYFGGLGALLEGDGDDRLDLAWYGAGAGVHFGVGLYLDAAGHDRLGDELTPRHLVLGAAHDFGLGLAVDQAGDDQRQLPSLSAGAASAGGLGIFVDAAGDDRYLSRAKLVLGAVNLSGPFPELATIGLCLDAGGVDQYPDAEGGPKDQSGWAGEVSGEDGLGLAGGADGQADLGVDLRWSIPR